LGAWGVKLEAIDDILQIAAGQGNVGITSADPSTERYVLSPAGERSEILLLRHGDVVHTAKSSSTITCRWSASEVQVNSSAADAVVAESVDANGNTETPEDETEDEDLDKSPPAVLATQSKSQQSRATPMSHLSHQRSIVVQETPTALRTLEPSHYPVALGTEESLSASVEESRPLEVAEQVDTEEAFSTARTTGDSQRKAAQHVAITIQNLQPPQSQDAKGLAEQLAPEVIGASDDDDVQASTRTSRKRPSPATDGKDPETDSEPVGRSSKRAKKTADSQDDTQDSRLSNVDVEIPLQAAAKRRGRKPLAASRTTEAAEATPSKSQRSSQRSATISADAYEGPIPRVLLSNSSITKSSQAARFLKKQGGALVDSMTDQFNILWYVYSAQIYAVLVLTLGSVRDGELHKTPKLLAAIAFGTPIVTDKWLIDSAKAGHFVSVSAYRPSAPKQEREWNVKFDQILGHAQTPFDGYTIHFTKNLKALYSPFTEIEQVCQAAGAKKVTSSRMDKVGNIIVLAKDEDDGEVEKLKQEGIMCYNRDLITHSIFRGSVDLDSSEFKIGPETAATNAPKGTKKKGRKSK
jgi:hypothetical protein